MTYNHCRWQYGGIHTPPPTSPSASSPKERKMMIISGIAVESVITWWITIESLSALRIKTYSINFVLERAIFVLIFLYIKYDKNINIIWYTQLRYISTI